MTDTLPALGEVVVDAASIRRRVAELAAAIDEHYLGIERPLVLLCVLTGSLIFTADLARAMRTPLEIESIRVRSYGAGVVSSGVVSLNDCSLPSLHERDVLIVEDIVDSGATISCLRDRLAQEGTRSVRLVALLDKTSRRAHRIDVDWRGFDIPDHFVVGYGLDHAGRWRNLADVHLLRGV
jgi:hypoxanthine phosphoribosyltransferase